MSEERTGAQIMCEALIREGVEVMFGIPGGAIMPFYHAMWEYRDQLRHVLCRHEQGAGHAAEGYARATGGSGVCLGTSGPGATNLVTPIADAWMDSTPLVAITGQVSSAVLGKDAFQETDITGITMPITKHNYLVKRVEDIAGRHPGGVPHGHHRAARPGADRHHQGRPAGAARCRNWDVTLDLPGYKPTYQGNRRQIREAIRLLIEAQQAADHGRATASSWPRRSDGAARAGRAHRHPGDHHPARPRRVPRGSPAQHRDAGHARLGACQPGDPAVRRAVQHRRAASTTA